MNVLNKFKKLKNKGLLFYVGIQIDKIKRRSTFFGKLFLKYYQYYTIDDVKISVNKDLFPLPLYSRFFFKIYEQEEISLLKKYLKGDEKVLELGACIGVVSCVTNSLLDAPDKHVVVEANPELLPYLEQNKNNNKSQFTIVNGVVSKEKQVKFYSYHSALTGSLVKQNHTQELIDSCTEHIIDGYSPMELEERYDVQFNTLVMDIEGGEFELIKQYKSWLKGLNMLMIEFHPNVLEQENNLSEYIQLLKDDCNFQLTESYGGSYVFHKKIA